MITMGSPFDAVMIEMGRMRENKERDKKECLYHMWRNDCTSSGLRLNLSDKI